MVNCYSFWRFRPIPLPRKPSYFAEDVTVIIPTLDGDNETLRRMLPTCIETEPREIILVTIDANLKKASELVRGINDRLIRVLSIPQANKRLQTERAIPEVRTKITVLADDDVLWPETLLEWILAPFENLAIGGVGTCQRLQRAVSPTWQQRFWNFFGALYLERRNFDIAACTYMDGGVPCLSGRTVAYRTCILQDDDFKYEFTHETWGKYQLNADDDNFVTRWMVSHGWKTYVQYHPDAEVQTTLEDNSRFLRQCLRWCRSNWRSNLTSMFVERTVWSQQPWSTYAVHLTTLTAWAALSDFLLFFTLYEGTTGLSINWRRTLLGVLALLVCVTKWIKLVGHYRRFPADILMFPLSILFGYAHGIIKIYAMCTLNETTWGSRPNADTEDYLRMMPPPQYYHTPKTVDGKEEAAPSKTEPNGVPSNQHELHQLQVQAFQQGMLICTF
ncbi:MAG: hypothetical protein M1828_002949 [Chrysothrix sp. TS-e1954]|nr:MAG: hypothetical protein M1828_002949 [Chrysothrix sp. TS-e1954]